ncbi:hypothetical protein GE061_011985 [Apolygus lucorum]|uniref:Uncharacterized protein n=1 Tax=Apolygus lucorum TaxID=248454 RepID=A0A6A4JKW4_APOLU|nr:hypothetical protein GE061_011985 [Apolygus lucorum]
MVILFLLCGLTSITCSQSEQRVKRIVGGKELLHHTSYAVTKYFVWLSNAHFCSFTGSFNNFISELSKPDSKMSGYIKGCDVVARDVLCGGALLTTRIVQTACHCVARVSETDSESQGQYTSRRFVPKSAFTDFTVAFVGHTSISNMKLGFSSKAFIIHEKCARVESLDKFTSYDYGIVVLKKEVTPNVNDPTVVPQSYISDPSNFAPVYALDDLTYMWWDLMSKEKVCLFVGFGFTTDSNDRENTPRSAVLQHVWNTVKGYDTCKLMTEPHLKSNNYSELVTNLCATSLAGQKTTMGHGDSGAPVTCDNRYVGIVSSGGRIEFPAIADNYFDAPAIEARVSWFAPTVYAPLPNSAEHRASFVYNTLKSADDSVRKDSKIKH